MAVDNVRIARWLESLHTVRVSGLEREEPTSQVTMLYFRDIDGAVHTVSVNPDGTPREYKDPKGHVHQYNIHYKPPAQPAPVPAAAAPMTMAAVTADARAHTRTAPSQGRTHEVAVAPTDVHRAAVQPAQQTPMVAAASPPAPATVTAPAPAQQPRPPMSEARTRVAAASTPSPPRASRPPRTSAEAPSKQQKRSLEEVVIDWADKNQGLSGASVLRREITTKGITFRLKGPDGAEYEAITGMDQKVKSFRKV